MSAFRQLVFFLGGQDLEMRTIRALLQERRVPFHDHGLAWGAAASAYRAELAAALAAGQTPVLVELPLDLPLPAAQIQVVDHHNERAGREQPTALEQVFQLLGLPRESWTRWHALIAANDRGHIAALVALEPPASPDEIREVRAADRAAQGVTPDEEAAAPAAVTAARVVAEGQLTVVVWPHPHGSPVADRMESALGGPGFQRLLVCTPSSVSYFGDGQTIDWLRQQFPGGWWGGELPERGFWGGPHPGAEVERALTGFLSKPADQV